MPPKPNPQSQRTAAQRPCSRPIKPSIPKHFIFKTLNIIKFTPPQYLTTEGVSICSKFLKTLYFWEKTINNWAI
jgi:hypothetical protein